VPRTAASIAAAPPSQTLPSCGASSGGRQRRVHHPSTAPGRDPHSCDRNGVPSHMRSPDRQRRIHPHPLRRPNPPLCASALHATTVAVQLWRQGSRSDGRRCRRQPNRAPNRIAVGQQPNRRPSVGAVCSGTDAEQNVILFGAAVGLSRVSVTPLPGTGWCNGSHSDD